jgi:peroxiredoxin
MLRLLPILCLFILCSCNADPAPAAAPEEKVVEVKEYKANPIPVEEQEVQPLAIGADAPDFKLMGVDGEYHTLADYSDAEMLVIVFICNHCPTAQAYEQRLKDFTTDYKSAGVQVVAISPNSPLGVMYNELGYSDLDDRYEDMVLRDAGRKLRYVGRMDKHEKPGTLNADDLRRAVDEILAGKEVTTPKTKTFGCATKWAWKANYKVKDEQQWKDQPVSMEAIDVAGVQDLLKNNSDNLRLINLWATWCGPCVAEYPDFIVLQRMYGARNFEFVSISLDKPGKGPAALKFLEKSHSSLTNYHFASGNTYDLIEAIDPDWNGAIPYTIMVAPGGDVVYKQQAEVDFLELRRVIVEHPLIGRYF